METRLTFLFLWVFSPLLWLQSAVLPSASAQSLTEVRAKAEMGDAQSQFDLGFAFSFGGLGLARDKVEELKWYRKAAEQNHVKAQHALGTILAFSPGTAGEGVSWLHKAAEQKNVGSQVLLGSLYRDGQGAVRNYVEAAKWYHLAGAQGDDGARRLLSALEPKMTREQIAQAEKLARDFNLRRTPQSGGEKSRPGGSDPEPKSSGTGFFITEDGYLVTNQHVVADSAKVLLIMAAGTIEAKVVKVDKANDLALLKATGRLTALPVVTSRGVRLGATVATVGFPNPDLQGFAPKLARGEIASLAGAQDDARHFQISAPIQPGNSGGALVDERGNVIGVVVAKLSQRAALATSGALAENVNYAVKSSYLLSFLESVPEVAAKLKEAHSKERKFEDVVKSVEQATVLVLVY